MKILWEPIDEGFQLKNKDSTIAGANGWQKNPCLKMLWHRWLNIIQYLGLDAGEEIDISNIHYITL